MRCVGGVGDLEHVRQERLLLLVGVVITDPPGSRAVADTERGGGRGARGEGGKARGEGRGGTGIVLPGQMNAFVKHI